MIVKLRKFKVTRPDGESAFIQETTNGIITTSVHGNKHYHTDYDLAQIGIMNLEGYIAFARKGLPKYTIFKDVTDE